MVDELTYKNPIDKWFEQEAVIQANGLDNCRKYAANAKSKCPLDYKTAPCVGGRPSPCAECVVQRSHPNHDGTRQRYL